MIFKVPGGTQIHDFGNCFLYLFLAPPPGQIFSHFCRIWGLSWPSMGPSWPPMGSQKGSQNHEKSTPEGVSKQGWSPGEAQGLPGGSGT